MPLRAEDALRLLGRQQGKSNGELGALVDLTGNGDLAAMLLNDSPGDREPQAGAVRLGGEEWLEEAT